MAAFSIPGSAEWLILAPILVFAIAVQLYPLWRICERLGRPGSMSLISLVPYGGIVYVLWSLALREPPDGPRG